MAAYNLGRMLNEAGEQAEALRWLRSSTDPLAAELLHKIAPNEPS
jgi:hypothetical protein